jgi:octaprenyl-diphosphate synthase
MKSETVGIERLFDAYEAELRLVEEHLRGMFQSNVVLIPLIGRHLADSGGKRMRPLFLLMSARLSGYGGKDQTALAGIVEAVHTASLLHDDVVDGSDVRRGNPAANSIWGNQAVVLVGDFLYSNALKHAVAFGSHRIIESLSAVITKMTQGELLQLQKLGDLEITEKEYIEIASCKTGALISTACRIGAILGKSSPEKVEALTGFGLKVGIAFQIIDDILDYMAAEVDLGKKLGKDFEEGKVTLPVIYLLRTVSETERDEVKNILENDLSGKSLKRMLELFRRHNVIEESAEKAKGLVDMAKKDLMVFSPSPERDDMFDLAEYALKRDR